MSAMKVLVLVDGLHSGETLEAVARLLDLKSAELLLAYIEGPAPRAGLDVAMGRPAGAPLPPRRKQELREAESSAGDAAISDAERAARAVGGRFETIRLTGEAGREICELAARRQADLVVVRAGGRDRPPIGPGSLGPAAKFIADHCKSPVLLLRTG
jgi:nucleotide-binding universal stress UspA family protein